MNNLKSPFRYPGAKTRLLKNIIKYMDPLFNESTVYVEPFIGGGSVLLGVYNHFPSLQKYIINDLDFAISSFWKCMADEDLFKLFFKKINTIPTVQEHSLQKEMIHSKNIEDSAFASFFLNRTSFSGILTSGPIGGYEQKSKYKVDCRYNQKELSKRIKQIHDMIGNKLIVSNDDFEDVIKRFDNSNVVIYCDAPYYEKGDKLYRCKMSHKDHQRLADCVYSLKNANVLISYDDSPEIRNMYKWANIIKINVQYSINGKNRKSWNKKNELLIIGKNSKVY